MDKKYLYFTVYYYFYIFYGGYPLTKNNNDILLNHFIRKFLGIDSRAFEIDLINLMRHSSKKSIKEKAYIDYPLLAKNSNNKERIILIANTLSLIKREANKPIKQPRYLDPDHYKYQTGKQFRMNQSQIDRGLNREEAFQEFVKELDNKNE